MNQQQAEKLLELSQQLYILITFNGSYVDGHAMIYKNSYGDIVFLSRVYEDEPVVNWSVSSVTVSKVIHDWME